MQTLFLTLSLFFIILTGLVLLQLVRMERTIFGALMDLLDEQEKTRRRLARPTVAIRSVETGMFVTNLSNNPAVNVEVLNSGAETSHPIGLLMGRQEIPLPESIDPSQKITIRYAATRGTLYATYFSEEGNVFQRKRRSANRHRN